MDKRGELRNKLEGTKAFVLDMDGTIYLGDRLFEETVPFLEKIRETGRDFYFFTNNSSRNKEAYIAKLHNMGIDISPAQMMISNEVIIKWLLENRRGERAFVVGTEYLVNDFLQAGIEIDEENPDYVVLGFDTSLTYEKISKACGFIRDGAPVFGVNADWNCPVEGGFIPDCGSIAALVKASTGVQCEFFGKPSRHTLDYITGHLGLKQSEIAIVGDRLYTDIAVAAGSEVLSVLVMSGETTHDMLRESEIVPDIVVRDIGELGEYL